MRHFLPRSLHGQGGFHKLDPSGIAAEVQGERASDVDQANRLRPGGDIDRERRLSGLVVFVPGLAGIEQYRSSAGCLQDAAADEGGRSADDPKDHRQSGAGVAVTEMEAPDSMTGGRLGRSSVCWRFRTGKVKSAEMIA